MLFSAPDAVGETSRILFLGYLFLSENPNCLSLSINVKEINLL